MIENERSAIKAITAGIPTGLAIYEALGFLPPVLGIAAALGGGGVAAIAIPEIAQGAVNLGQRVGRRTQSLSSVAPEPKPIPVGEVPETPSIEQIIEARVRRI